MRGRHTSLDKHLKPSIAWIEAIPAVSKVVLGFAESCRHKYPPGHIRWKQDVAGGIKINAYSGNGVIDIFLKIDPITECDEVKQLIARRFAS